MRKDALALFWKDKPHKRGAEVADISPGALPKKDRIRLKAALYFKRFNKRLKINVTPGLHDVGTSSLPQYDFCEDDFEVQVINTVDGKQEVRIYFGDAASPGCQTMTMDILTAVKLRKEILKAIENPVEAKPTGQDTAPDLPTQDDPIEQQIGAHWCLPDCLEMGAMRVEVEMAWEAYEQAMQSDDIPASAEAFLERYEKKHGKQGPHVRREFGVK
jgi:hypothetical protein